MARRGLTAHTLGHDVFEGQIDLSSDSARRRVAVPLRHRLHRGEFTHSNGKSKADADDVHGHRHDCRSAHGQRKDLEQLLREFHHAGWRIENPPTYYRVKCPCGQHKRMIHLTPSNPRYAANVRAWLNRQHCESPITDQTGEGAAT